ncbi:MAG TPA: PQQ-binding-like beta-propeller repeat protein [Planctomycetota bacterium]|nr:PQQ-binding-like beta-propeller repeat protein [Planctomycetota bacterium]
MTPRFAPVVWLTVALAARAEVAGWRTANATYPDATPPLEWGAEEKPNIRWKAQVGKSYSSPIVVAGKVFVAAEPDWLVCLDAATGKVLWKVSNSFADAGAEEKPVKSNAGNTAATPTSDGERVWAVFASGIVACYDVDGKRQWIRYFGLPMLLQFARAASPVLAGDKLLVTLNHLFALDARTGKLLWKAEEVHETYGTPAVAKIGDTEVALTPEGYAVRLADGKVLASELGTLKYGTPFVRQGVAYFIGFDAKALRLPPQAGDKLVAKELWTAELEGEFFSSPVYLEGLLYIVNDAGMLYALDAKTGKTVVEKELDLPNASGKPGTLPAHIYPSIVLAGKHLFVFNDIGTCLILAPGREPKAVGRNSLPAGAPGTPVFAGKHVFARGGQSLYCIGE